MTTELQTKHFEVWKVIFHGEGTEAENYGFRRHWKIVDKIETGEIETAFESVLQNLTDYGYIISSSACPVVTAKFEKEKEETFVVSPAGKEYNWNDWEYEDNHTVLESKAFLVVEPGVELEFILSRFVRMGAGISYRFTNSIKVAGNREYLLNGMSGAINLKFGLF